MALRGLRQRINQDAPTRLTQLPCVMDPSRSRNTCNSSCRRRLNTKISGKPLSKSLILAARIRFVHWYKLFCGHLPPMGPLVPTVRICRGGQHPWLLVDATPSFCTGTGSLHVLPPIWRLIPRLHIPRWHPRTQRRPRLYRQRRLRRHLLPPSPAPPETTVSHSHRQ